MEIRKVENETPDISLISGKARYVQGVDDKSSADDLETQSESKALISRDQLLTVAQYSAGKFTVSAALKFSRQLMAQRLFL